MQMKKAVLPAIGLTALLALAGCAGAAGTPTTTVAADRIAVVASTNVYGQIVEAVGGDRVAVTSLVSSASQDPHEYNASATDQLSVRDAALIVENGGGYDPFVDDLVTASGSTAPVVVAAEYSHSWPGGEAGHAETSELTATPHAEEDHDHAHVEGFNEHVWYDPHTVAHVAEAVRDALTALRPADTDLFAANTTAFTAQLDALESRLDALKTAHEGQSVVLTEPVAGYLVAAAGLNDVMPPAFSEAVEEGQDVPPATLLDALALVNGGTVRVVIANAQTGGSETTQIIDAARAKGIPVLEFTETVPDGQTYTGWMTQNIEQLEGALA